MSYLFQRTIWRTLRSLGHMTNIQRRYLANSVSLETIFSQENKLRCQGLFSESKPLMTRKLINVDKEVKVREAAVLVPLCRVNGEPSILFTLRSNLLPQHRGEVCFPGGMSDPADSDLTHTALRECEEELGIPQDLIQIWGQMPPLPSRKDGKIMTSSIIGYCGELDVSNLKINHHEVEEVFCRSIASLCDPDHNKTTQFRSGRGYTMPAYTGGVHHIWGLTAIMLHQALTILAPGLYTKKIRHQPYLINRQSATHRPKTV